jgi:tetratricopeptide (TPR) repeat protein
VASAVYSAQAHGAADGFRQAMAPMQAARGHDARALTAEQRATAHGRTGELLHQQKRLTEAATAYEEAFRAAPGTAYGLLCKAKACALRGQLADAQRYLEELVRHPTSRAEDAQAQSVAHLGLGELLTEAGRFDEARASFERAIAVWPAQASAYHGLVRSRKIVETDRPLVANVLKRLEATDLTPHDRMLLHFAAGKALDDLRDYAAAIAQFDAANRIRRKLNPFDRRAFERLVDRFIARFTPAFFAHHAALVGSDDETPVLVLGMPRSGTTLIERFISSHPRVGGGGELPFWMKNAGAWVEAEPEKLAAGADRLRAEYLRVLRTIDPEALRVTDKAPANFAWIGLLHVLMPKARFVHCRRNPIDTCLSIYSTYFTSVWAFTSDWGDLASFYRQYLRLMAHWRSVIPSDRLLEVDYEDATSAPEQTARRIIAFCGLEWDDACLRPDRNEDAIRTASLWQARQPVYRSAVERWRNYEPWLGELRALLAEA